MKRQNHTPPSPFKALESHFLNAFHSGLYLSAQELANIGQKYGIEVPLKTRELIIKNLLNDAQKIDKLQEVILDISNIINERTQALQDLSANYPNAADFLASIMQKVNASNLLLKRQQVANPYE